jgi:hypothetical protein
MNMRDIIRLLENVIVEHQRVAVWSGATITVLHNPTKLTFEKFIQKHPSLRGLISEDGKQVWLWPAYMAVHPNIIQELGLDRCECIFWNRGRWAGPNIHDSNGLYKPALQRLSPASPAHHDVSDDELMNLLKEDSEYDPMDFALWWVSRWVSGSEDDEEWEWDEATSAMTMDQAFLYVAQHTKTQSFPKLYRALVLTKAMANKIITTKVLPKNKRIFQSFTTSAALAMQESHFIRPSVGKGGVRLLIEIDNPPILFALDDLKQTSIWGQLEDWHHQKEVFVDGRKPLRITSAKIFNNNITESTNNIPFHMPESIEVEFVGHFDPDTRIAHIGSIISKKRGEGGKAVRAFEAWSKEQGAKRIEGSARPDSLPFWNKMGFRDRSRGESLIPIWKTIW